MNKITNYLQALLPTTQQQTTTINTAGSITQSANDHTGSRPTHNNNLNANVNANLNLNQNVRTRRRRRDKMEMDEEDEEMEEKLQNDCEQNVRKRRRIGMRIENRNVEDKITGSPLIPTSIGMQDHRITGSQDTITRPQDHKTTRSQNVRGKEKKKNKTLMDYEMKQQLKILQDRNVRNHINIVAWNVKGGLSNSSTKAIVTRNYINRDYGRSSACDIACIQECLGTAGIGYTKRYDNEFARIHNMEKLCADPCGVTAVYCRIGMRGTVPLTPPEYIYSKYKGVNRIYCCGCVIYTKKEKIIVINLYKPPSRQIQTMTNHLKQLSETIDWVKKAAINGSIILCGDANIWHESIGSIPRERNTKTMKYKYRDGDRLMRSMESHNFININDGAPTFVDINGEAKKC